MFSGAFKPWHIIVLIIVILLVFGSKRLPDMARSVGKSLKIFKSEVKDLTDGDAPAEAATGAPSTPPPPADPGADGPGKNAGDTKP